MSNEMKDYVDNFRANLPAGITYDSTIARYFCNNRRFLNEWEVERYLSYIKKFGFSAGFDPASLFASGEAGAWYDLSDLSKLFQDSAGTTAVTADGDPVGSLLDKSGNGNHATQAVSAARPIYHTDGTFHWLKGDGIDDSISSPKSLDYSNAAEFWMFAAAQHISGPVAIALNGSDFQYLRIDEGQIFARSEIGNLNGASLAIAPWSASPVVWLIRVRQSDRSVTVFRDGVNVGGLTLPGSSWWPTLMRMTLFAAQPNQAETASKIYQAGTIAKALTQGGQDNLTQFLAAKAGVTL
jgi:hypothetical protein